ncbi:hypothetical protein ILUMI_04812 [Ignelater luminosus]|uniref:Uncharacterized protein n=1 Tax=Ignelater luminosus TaxID=2038154 RepID=A0A8K0D8G4_IGNLU|nr:hypothetical protein ILUMI_04812 [Ignelater luminosus]
MLKVTSSVGRQVAATVKDATSTVKRELQKRHVLLQVYSVKIGHFYYGIHNKQYIRIFAITTRFDHDISASRNFRRHINTLPFPDWELGLREAVYQALLRERNLLPHLREYLHSAPIIGRQDTATPFGDIAIVARGQLYSAPGGFQFVQDPYQNDCDGCHNAPPRCDRASCENWKPQGHERLLALWTVKRIRHRDSNYGYRYEMEYKVTPMNVAANEHFITRNGRFDYSVPGHTFIVKADSKQSDSPFQRIKSISDKVYRSSQSFNTNHWSPNNYGPNFDAHYLPPPPPVPPINEYYDNDPRNVGYPNVLYGPPELYTRRPPYTRFTTKKYPQPHDSQEDEQDSFNNFFDPFSSTSTTRTTTLSTSTTTQPSKFDLFANTQTSPPLFIPAITTKTSVKPTFPTLTESLPKTTQRDISHHSTSAQTQLLPTIPIQASSDQTTEILQNTPLTMHSEDVFPIKPLVSSPTVRFPTVATSRYPTSLLQEHTTQTTPTTHYSEKVNFVKYSEPDPLYSTASTQSTHTFSTRTTKQYRPMTTRFRTTESDDYDIFGDNKMTSERPIRIKFPGVVNVKLPPGEQVITVVDAPTMMPKFEQEQKSTLPITESTQTNILTPKYQVDFNNRQLLHPGNESYVTVSLIPSTRNQQSTPKSTSSTESSTRYEITTKNIILSKIPPIRESSENHPELTTKRYVPITKNYIAPERVTITPLTKTTSRSIRYTPRTKSFTRTTLSKTTTPLTTISSTTDLTSTMTSFRSTPLSISTVSASIPYLSKPRTTVVPVITTSVRTITLPTKRRTSPSINLPPITRKMYSTLRPLTLRTKPTQSKSTLKTSTMITTNEVTTPFLPTTIQVSRIPEKTTYASTFAFTTASTQSTEFETTNPPTATHISEPTTQQNTRITTILDVLTSTTLPEISETDLSTMSTKSVVVSNVSATTSSLPSSIPTTVYVTPSAPVSTVFTTPISIPTVITTDSEIHTTEIATSTSNHLSMTQSTKLVPSSTSSIKSTTDDFPWETKNIISSKRPVTREDENFELDIFGRPQDKSTKLIPPEIQNKQSFNSKEIDDIFGVSEKSETLRNKQKYTESNTESSSLTTSTLKVIYSNFYSPSTALTTEKPTRESFSSETKENNVEITTVNVFNNSSGNINDKATESEALTKQSYSTSASFEVTKNKITTEKDLIDTHSESDSVHEDTLPTHFPNKSEYKQSTQIPCNNATEKSEAFFNPVTKQGFLTTSFGTVSKTKDSQNLKQRVVLRLKRKR